jgi:hypothetical protein
MMKKLLFTLSLLIVTSYTFAQITTLPASESFTTTFTQGVPATFLPNWTGSNVATTNKIFQDLTDYNSAPAALSIIPTSSFDGDVQVNLNLTSYQSVAVSFMAKSMLNGVGTRDVVLTMTTSIDGGTSWIGSTLIASLPNANQTAFTSYTYTLPVEAINQANVLVRFYVTRGATGTSTAAKLVIDDVTIQQSTTPQITLSQTALTFTQVSGVPSQSQSVNVSGSNLVGNVTLTPPTNFEVSLAPTSGFASTLNLVPTLGNIVSTPIYVRLNSASNGSFTGNLVVATSGVTAQNVALIGSCVIPTVTNPNPLSITDNSSNSILSQWDNTNVAGTYPPNMALWSHATADPDLNTLFVEDWSCLYNLTARSRFTGEGVNGISMINTGNSQFTGVCDGTDPTQATGTTVASGRAGAIVLALNTSGVVNNGSQISINWTGRTILQNLRAYGLRMQYRIGTAAGNPNAGWLEFPTTQEYLSGADNTSTNITTALPLSCNGQPVVQVRWVYNFINGTGARAQVALDDVSIVVGNLGNNIFALANDEFKMYPNPVNGDKIHFNVASDVTVSDVSGKQVLNAKNATELNVSQLNSGIYFVRNAEGKVLKLIK